MSSIDDTIEVETSEIVADSLDSNSASGPGGNWSCQGLADVIRRTRELHVQFLFPVSLFLVQYSAQFFFHRTSDDLA